MVFGKIAALQQYRSEPLNFRESLSEKTTLRYEVVLILLRPFEHPEHDTKSSIHAAHANLHANLH